MHPIILSWLPLSLSLPLSGFFWFFFLLLKAGCYPGRDSVIRCSLELRRGEEGRGGDVSTVSSSSTYTYSTPSKESEKSLDSIIRVYSDTVYITSVAFHWMQDLQARSDSRQVLKITTIHSSFGTLGVRKSLSLSLSPCFFSLSVFFLTSFPIPV